ncbi:MAG: aldehyde dehydrogenase (NAD+) [Oleiphilaceae bacterium]|jgi:aldehyde dehydrogenase (NAD+)
MDTKDIKKSLKKVLAGFYDEHNHYGSAYVGVTRLDSQNKISAVSPINAQQFASISIADASQLDFVVAQSYASYLAWRSEPAPKRGELVRLFGVKLRQHKNELASIITLESGKPLQESLGEVQELIDVCDFAVGLSRQLYGLTISTERKDHRMMEQWHPIGPILVISAFNFPMAVWGWNVTLALVCGNSVVWKPSCQCPLSALACHRLLLSAIEDLGGDPNLSSVVYGEQGLVRELIDLPDIALVSATGSCSMGRTVGACVAKRMGRSLLELGGNNAMIVCPSANIDLAIRAIIFSALGTSGQRCTSLRRLIVHESLKDEVLARLEKIYASVTIGDPFDERNLMGPLINLQAIKAMTSSIKSGIDQGGELITGGKVINNLRVGKGFYITPALMVVSAEAAIVQAETFAPLLFVHSYRTLDVAIDMHNNVRQGLSSAIFTQNISEAELFLSAKGSDCGIANVNIGTSGAEIGGAFGGEKETGGGRESGSDAWKNYMRRVTNTINYGEELPLAQGVNFDLPE